MYKVMRQCFLPRLLSSELMMSSKSEPSPKRFIMMISLFNSKTEIPVPSKATLVGSFCDLNLKKTEEDMVSSQLAPDGSGSLKERERDFQLLYHDFAILGKYKMYSPALYYTVGERRYSDNRE